jgi:tRNA threonylcarbamoyl adenosine modification protein (Sua5/YciO/YrdC/YwlC family)
MTRTFATTDPLERERGLVMAASVVRRGGLVVLPVESSYAVATDPFREAGIAALLASKGRAPGTPVAIMVPSAATLDGILERVTPTISALTRAFWPGDLTLVARSARTLSWGLGGTPGTVTVRMPLHPVALELLGRSGLLAVMAANGPGLDPPRACTDALDQLTGTIEVALDAGPRRQSPPSSIVDVTGEVPVLVREAAISAEALLAVAPDLEVRS